MIYISVPFKMCLILPLTLVYQITIKQFVKKKRKEKWNCIVPIFDVKGVEKKTIGTSPLL